MADSNPNPFPVRTTYSNARAMRYMYYSMLHSSEERISRRRARFTRARSTSVKTHDSVRESVIDAQLRSRVITNPESRSDKDCAVCLENLYEKETVAVDCGHEYHFGCMKEWLMRRRSNSCPLCRSEAIKGLTI